MEITLQDSSLSLLRSTETCRRLALPCTYPLLFSLIYIHLLLCLPLQCLICIHHIHQGTNASSLFCLLLSVGLNIGCLLNHEVYHSFVLSFGRRRVNQHYLSSLKAVSHLLVTLICHITPKYVSQVYCLN